MTDAFFCTSFNTGLSISSSFTSVSSWQQSPVVSAGSSLKEVAGPTGPGTPHLCQLGDDAAATIGKDKRGRTLWQQLLSCSLAWIRTAGASSNSSSAHCQWQAVSGKQPGRCIAFLVSHRQLTEIFFALLTWLSWPTSLLQQTRNDDCSIAAAAAS